MDSVSIPIEITKRDDERRMVFGFAKFAEDPDNRGFLYLDKQGDYITPDDLENSAYSYTLNARKRDSDAGEMHITKGAGNLVESVFISPEKLEAWGLEPDSVPVSWWVGYHIGEVEKGAPDPFDKIKKGEYTAFSVDGLAVREPIQKGSGPTASAVHSDRPLEEDEDEDSEDEGDKKATQSKDEVKKALDDYADLLSDPTATLDDIEKAEGDLLLVEWEPLPLPDFTPQVPAGEEGILKRFVNWMFEVEEVAKHKAPDHPESAHGNRLFSKGTEDMGELMKRLKTRYKRTDENTLRQLRQKFSKSGDAKDLAAHDEVVVELVRRNIMKPSSMTFKTDKFKKNRDAIIHAVTEELTSA